MTWFRRNVGWLGLLLLFLGALFAWVEASMSEALQVLRGVPGIGSILLAASGILLVLHLIWNWDRVKLFSQSRTRKYGTNAAVYTLAVAGILAVLNILAARNDLRWDTTTERFHSLSAQSRKVLGELDQPVTAHAFLAESHPGRQTAEDLLALMRGAAGGAFRYEFVNPLTEPDRAREFEVTQPTEIILDGSGGRSRVTEITEVGLMNGLLEATRERKPVICFVQGHGERSMQSEEQPGYALAAQALGRDGYTTAEVRLPDQESLQGVCDVLVLAGPTEPLLEGERDRLLEYLKTGGGVLALLDPERDGGIEDLLYEHGIALARDQIIQLNPLQGFSYFNPLGVSYGTHPISEALNRTQTTSVFFDARSVEPTEASQFRPELDTQCLTKTGARTTYAESEPGVIDLKPDPETDRLGPICLGVASRLDPSKLPVEMGKPTPPLEDPERRLVVWGDADFAANLFVSLGANQDLFLNSVGWLARRGELLDIRSPNRRARTILLEASQVRLIQAVTLYGLPLIVLVGGLGIWFHRRRL